MKRGHYTVTHTQEAGTVDVTVTLHRVDGSTVDFLFSSPTAACPGRPEVSCLGVKAHEVRGAIEHCSRYLQQSVAPAGQLALHLR